MEPAHLRQLGVFVQGAPPRGEEVGGVGQGAGARSDGRHKHHAAGQGRRNSGGTMRRANNGMARADLRKKPQLGMGPTCSRKLGDSTLADPPCARRHQRPLQQAQQLEGPQVVGLGQGGHPLARVALGQAWRAWGRRAWGTWRAAQALVMCELCLMVRACTPLNLQSTAAGSWQVGWRTTLTWTPPPPLLLLSPTHTTTLSLLLLTHACMPTHQWHSPGCSTFSSAALYPRCPQPLPPAVMGCSGQCCLWQGLSWCW